MKLMKTVKYLKTSFNGYKTTTKPIEVIQRSGGLVTCGDEEYPFAGEGYIENLINTIEEGKHGVTNIEVYYTDYKTGIRVELEDANPSDIVS